MLIMGSNQLIYPITSLRQIIKVTYGNAKAIQAMGLFIVYPLCLCCIGQMLQLRLFPILTIPLLKLPISIKFKRHIRVIGQKDIDDLHILLIHLTLCPKLMSLFTIRFRQIFSIPQIIRGHLINNRIPVLYLWGNGTIPLYRQCSRILL